MTEIYYVEDDENISRAVRTYLERQGYKIFVFQTIANAKQAMQHTCPDMVLVDRNMPDGSGNSLCQWIRSTYKELPVIFCFRASALYLSGQEICLNNIYPVMPYPLTGNGWWYTVTRRKLL